MANPVITIMNADSTSPTTEWHLGTIKALEESSVLTINVWNNKNGSTDVSDLVDTTITATDINGGDDEQAVSDRWTYVCVAATATTDSAGNKTFTQIGKGAAAPVAANGATGDNLTNHVIRGVANDGTMANSSLNFANIQVKIIAPLNTTAGSHQWKLKLQGYFS